MANQKLVIPASYPDIRIADECLRSIMLASKISDEVVSGCELALHELLINLVDHAYCGDSSGQITINLRLEEDVLQIQTFDTGNPVNVDLNNISMPEPETFSEGGYGMALIQMLVDNINYQRSGNQNIWTLVKRIT